MNGRRTDGVKQPAIAPLRATVARLRGAVALLIVGMLAMVCPWAWGAPSSASGTPDGADRQFRAIVARFIDSDMRLHPERATEDGDHRFDNRLGNLSQSGIQAKIRHAREWKARFLRLPAAALSPPNEADREWLIAHLDAELLWNEEVKFYRSDPGAYMPTAAVDSLIKRDFAPLAQRMRSVTAREQAAWSTWRRRAAT
jgi:hypothetical protein